MKTRMVQTCYYTPPLCNPPPSLRVSGAIIIIIIIIIAIAIINNSYCYSNSYPYCLQH